MPHIKGSFHKLDDDWTNIKNVPEKFFVMIGRVA